MECNKDDAVRAKELAEKKILENDIIGARRLAVKAHSLFPELDGISQLLEVTDLLVASVIKINGEIDYYGILRADRSSDEEALKKQYRRRALALHPDKNQAVGASEAFKLLSEAWGTLSDQEKRRLYDVKTEIRAPQRFAAVNLQPVVKNNGIPIFSGGSSSSSRRSSTTAADPLHVPPQESTARSPFPSTAGTSFPRTGADTQYHSARQYPQNPISGPRMPHIPHARKAPVDPQFISTPPAMRNPPPSTHHHFTAARNAQVNSGPVQTKHATFWTSCNRCRVQYEYLKIYLNQTLLCPGCKRPFMAAEMPAPNIGSFRRGRGPIPYQRQGSFAASTGSGSMPASTTNTQTSANEGLKRRHEKTVKMARDDEAQHNGHTILEEAEAASASNANSSSVPNMGNPFKRRHVFFQNSDGAKYGGHATAGSKSGMYRTSSDLRGNSVTDQAASSSSYRPRSERELTQMELRGMLMAKAKTEVLRQLNEWKISASISSVTKKGEIKNTNPVKESLIRSQRTDQPVDPNNISEPESPSNLRDSDDANTNLDESVAMTVPDADFHIFDEDRMAESFGDNQVWAMYDDDDGMPRFYALVHRVISRNPFEMQISRLTCKSTSEFGSLNWIGCGFSKTSGHFRIGKLAVNKMLNSFSHPVKWKKGAKGAIQIFPEKGDVWAMYRNWSPHWDALTSDDTIHQYDFVVVIEDYDEDRGISVAPLIKVAGYTSVFRQHSDQREIQTIPREEMFRFSHQVPSYLLNGHEAPDSLYGCYELDPAALPQELLKVTTGAEEAKEEKVSEHHVELTGPEAENEVRAEAADAGNTHGNMDEGQVENSKPILTYTRKNRSRNSTGDNGQSVE